MSTDVYNFKWKHFNVNQDCSLKELFINNKDADVTLVSDDKVAFHAHKLVLSACSSVLKDLLLNNPNPQPMIFMRGVKRFELESLLQFIYLGNTKLYQSRIEKFFENGRDLEIKQLSQPLINNYETFVSDGEPNSRKDDHLERNDIDEERNDLSVEESNQRMMDKENFLKSYSCEKCEDTMFNSMIDMSCHRKNMHGSAMYNCDICQYKTPLLNRMKRHKESIHDGVRYSCDSCDYKATKLTHLKTHKKSILYGVRYF